MHHRFSPRPRHRDNDVGKFALKPSPDQPPFQSFVAFDRRHGGEIVRDDGADQRQFAGERRFRFGGALLARGGLVGEDAAGIARSNLRFDPARLKTDRTVAHMVERGQANAIVGIGAVQISHHVRPITDHLVDDHDEPVTQKAGGWRWIADLLLAIGMRDLSVSALGMFEIPAARFFEPFGRAIDTIDMDVEVAAVIVPVGLMDRADHHPAVIRQHAAEARQDLMAVDR